MRLMHILFFREGRFLPLIAKELKARIPQFNVYTLDYEVVIFAYKDLETWLKVKWEMEISQQIRTKLEGILREKPDETNAFLSLWLDWWLKKWRERVKITQKEPEIPKYYLKRIINAKKLYRQMKHGDELKEIVVRKLVKQGEICLTEKIAENLIVQEIAKRIPKVEEDQKMRLNLLGVYNDLSRRISRLPKIKGPLIYLKIRTGMF